MNSLKETFVEPLHYQVTLKVTLWDWGYLISEWELEWGVGRVLTLLRGTEKGKTYSWQVPWGRFWMDVANHDCKSSRSLNPGYAPQVHPWTAWPNTQPPQDVIPEGSLSPALGEKPRLHVIFPARLPPAQKCCPGLKRNSTQLSQFCFLLLMHSAGVKISHAHIHMQRTFIKQWLRGGQKAPALDQSSPGQKQWEADLDPTRPLSSLWEVILSVRHSVFPSAK